MTLAQVQGAAALIVFLMSTWAGLIIAMALLLPKQARRAEGTLSDSPMLSLGVGLAMLIPLVISLGMLANPIGAIKLIGFLSAIVIGAALALGSSGMALLMGSRIGAMSNQTTGFSSLVRGSVAFSLALGFPFIGWFLFLPISLILSLGSGTMALRRIVEPAYPAIRPTGGGYDVLQ